MSPKAACEFAMGFSVSILLDLNRVCERLFLFLLQLLVYNFTSSFVG